MNISHQNELNLISGYLKLLPGPMFSSKTYTLTSELTTFADLGPNFKTLYINSTVDNRKTESMDENVTSHSSLFKKLSEKVHSVKVSTLKEVDITDYNIIGIDEGQFFPDVYETVIDWVGNKHKYVIVAFLDGDSFKRNFGDCYKLYSHANEYTKKLSYCNICTSKTQIITPNAPFTARLIDTSDTISPGGADKYMPVCRFHYEEHYKLHN